jgi:DNA-binding NtrC family response regulator
MQIDAWLRKRDKRGTLARVARQMFATGRKYSDLERNLQAFFVLEALLLNNGNQCQTASVVGISRNKINRILRQLGIKGADVRTAMARNGEK